MEEPWPQPLGLQSHPQKGWTPPGGPPSELGVARTPSDVNMQGPECLTFFVSFLGSSFADRPCPASSRCWAAQGAVRGRHLPPACPVGAAPRRPWSGGPGVSGGRGWRRLHPLPPLTPGPPLHGRLGAAPTGQAGGRWRPRTAPCAAQHREEAGQGRSANEEPRKETKKVKHSGPCIFTSDGVRATPNSDGGPPGGVQPF